VRVLLTEGSGLTSRQVAGRLRELGHDVGVVSADPIALTRFTRAVRRWHRVPAFGPDPLVWLDAALDVFRANQYDVLFPTQEQAAVLAWATEQERVDGVPTAVPPFSALAAVQDKISAYATLRRLKIPQPTSTVVEFDRLASWDTFPVFVKTPIGTATSGVQRVANADELARVIRRWTSKAATTTDGRILVQHPVDGPLAMVQTVFDHGRLVATHANLRTRVGVRGGASHKRSIVAPDITSLVVELGEALGWHGALSADVIASSAGPLIIDVNPRLVEPGNALRSGVDLVHAMLEISRGLHPPVQPMGRADVRTHQLLLAILGAAEQENGRRGIVTELWSAARHRGDYAASTEELTPIHDDWLAAAPVALAAATTLIRPGTWSWFSSGSITNYAITPTGWTQLTGPRIHQPNPDTTSA
jgi:biotin carboxylase